jgi:hypothetical protein
MNRASLKRTRDCSSTESNIVNSARQATAGGALKARIASLSPKLAEEGWPNMTFVTAASDAFFERLQNHVRAQRLYRAAIDRDHSFARTWYAFENLTALAAIVAIHDCRPARK